MIILVIFSVFFFQAEDGIRDTSVTGVQTCALPISNDVSDLVVADDIDLKITHIIRGADHISNTPKQVLLYQARSEERRVGKECRSRWCRYWLKKNEIM